MDFSSLLEALRAIPLDDVLVWAVAAVAGLVGVVAVANALDMYLEDTA